MAGGGVEGWAEIDARGQVRKEGGKAAPSY